MEMESVKIEKAVMKRVRAYTKEKRLFLSGYISDLLTSHMNRIDKAKSRKQPTKKALP